jgi:hypothetical protein
MNKNTAGGWKVTAAVLALGLCAGQASAADPVASNNTGNFTVRITPNVDLGVTVDTTGAAWAGDTDLDVDMDLGTEKLLGTGVKLTVAGNFQNQEFALSGANAATWTLDADDATAEENKLRLAAMIGADQNTELPTSAQFNGDGNLVVVGGPVRAGQSNANEGSATPGTGHVYEFADDAGAEYQQIDDMAVGQARRLWLRAKTPPTSTTDAQQAFVVTVTAMSGAAD